jgi:dihydroorotase-like cyclic amidohydrolase
MNRLIELCFENPKKIFNVKVEKNTWVEIDDKEEYIIDNKNLFTKCGWSPFSGFKVRGKVKRVFIRGKKVYEDGQVLVKPGDGRVIFR